MGKIIRLTENDLTRLVRRVIKEQPTMRCDKKSDLKAKFFFDKGLTKLAFNATIFTREMYTDGVSFEYLIAGRGRNNNGFVNCSENYTMLNGNKLYFTPEALNVILCGCKEYVSLNTKPSSNV